jgi:hypothetical protein
MEAEAQIDFLLSRIFVYILHSFNCCEPSFASAQMLLVLLFATFVQAAPRYFLCFTRCVRQAHGAF